MNRSSILDTSRRKSRTWFARYSKLIWRNGSATSRTASPTSRTTAGSRRLTGSPFITKEYVYLTHPMTWRLLLSVNATRLLYYSVWNKRVSTYLIDRLTICWQVPAPMVPKVKGAGDTRHFQSNEEDRDLFKARADNLHAETFKDF